VADVVAPSPADEAGDLKVKKYEELYKLSKEALVTENQRFEAAEVKVARYLSLIVLLLGASGVGGAEFSRLFRTAHTALGHTFLVAYFLTVLFAVMAATFFLRALAVQSVLVMPLGNEVVAHFDRNTYLDSIYWWSREFQGAAVRMRAETNYKFKLATTGYAMFVTAVVLTIASTMAYVAVKSTEERVTQSTGNSGDGGGSTGGAQQPAQPATPTVPSPNPNVQGPRFVEEKKSFEGPRETTRTVRKSGG
jgi:hypothetical protein